MQFEPLQPHGFATNFIFIFKFLYGTLMTKGLQNHLNQLRRCVRTAE